MQNITDYPTDLSVAEPTALVIVNGEPLEVESVSISRELSASMPSQVDAGSGITAATGNVAWAVGDDVQVRAAHPWDGNSFPPEPTDEVVVFAGYGVADQFGEVHYVYARQLTGIVDDSQGSIADGDVSSSLVDPIDKLNRTVSYPALLAVMPPPDEGDDLLHVGLQPTYITDRILRDCGFYATPPMTSSCVVSVPFMGSGWPEVGRVLDAGIQTAPTETLEHRATHWGAGLTSGQARYEPDLSRAGNNGRLSRSVQITLKADRAIDATDQSFVRANWGDTYLSLAVTQARSVIAYLHNGSSLINVCMFPSADVSEADVFTLRVNTEGVFTLLSNNGQITTGSASLPAVMGAEHMDDVWVYVEPQTGTRIGGVQVNFGITDVVNSEQTADLSPGASPYQLRAFPRIVGRNALDLLKEQAEAECAAMWIDEHGTFRWVNRITIANRAPVATLTALDDLLDIGWESTAAGVRSRVLVSSQEPSISRFNVSNQLAWQGKGESLEAGQDSEEIASPPADTDWIEVDEDLKLLPVGIPTFNRGRGSWSGGVATDDDGSQWATIDNPGLSVSMEKLADSVYKFTTNAGSPPSGRTIELRTPDEDSSTAIWRSKRDFDLPVLRSKAIVEWVDRETVGLHVGPQAAAVLEHDTGPWVQRVEALSTLADWISAQVFAPHPVLRDLSVIPDFRRQLGDVVWVDDQQNMRIRLKLLITKITTRISSGSAEQSVAGRILEVQAPVVTNAQLDEHVADFTNAEFDTLWADATNAQLDNDPLGRG